MCCWRPQPLLGLCQCCCALKFPLHAVVAVDQSPAAHAAPCCAAASQLAAVLK
jgi:hypothetical protein